MIGTQCTMHFVHAVPVLCNHGCCVVECYIQELFAKMVDMFLLLGVVPNATCTVCVCACVTDLLTP